jgi:hypothetical protein
MIEFLFSLVIIMLAFGGIAIGVLAGRGPIKGGCGGGDGACAGHCRRQCEHHGDSE